MDQVDEAQEQKSGERGQGREQADQWPHREAEAVHKENLKNRLDSVLGPDCGLKGVALHGFTDPSLNAHDVCHPRGGTPLRSALQRRWRAGPFQTWFEVLPSDRDSILRC